MDTVTQQNGWIPIVYNNTLGIKKNNYYYTTNQLYHFRQRPILETNPQLIHIGEYRPLLLDSNNFCALPIVLNNNNFFVNQLTNIVYIRPKDTTISVPGTMSYNFELFGRFTFAGQYNPYLNSTSTYQKPFLDVIPSNTYKTPIVDKNERQHVDPIENSLTSNPYPTKKEILPDENKPIVLQNNFLTNTSLITFLIPFFTSITKNIDSLKKSIDSIISKVQNPRIIVITNSYELKLDEKVMILPYTRYLGRLGYENRLNIIMKNECDIATFYNFLIGTYVKTSMFTIWNYNWEIEQWNNNIIGDKIFNVVNYYSYRDTVYKSQRSGVIGFLLGSKNRYSTSQDLTHTVVNGITMKNMDLGIIVRGNYSISDYEDRKGNVLFGNEIEMRDFYNKVLNEITVDYTEKIIS